MFNPELSCLMSVNLVWHDTPFTGIMQMKSVLVVAMPILVPLSKIQFTIHSGKSYLEIWTKLI